MLRKWGVDALSTYAPEGLTMAQHNYIASQNFVIHGDETGLMDTAWHDAEDVPRYTMYGIGTILAVVVGKSIKKRGWKS